MATSTQLLHWNDIDKSVRSFQGKISQNPSATIFEPNVHLRPKAACPQLWRDITLLEYNGQPCNWNRAFAIRQFSFRYVFVHFISTYADPGPCVEKERLPYELGWTPPTTETNLATLGAMVLQLQAANPEALPEGLTLGEGALRDVYQLRNPITGKLENATCILANTCN